MGRMCNKNGLSAAGGVAECRTSHLDRSLHPKSQTRGRSAVKRIAGNIGYVATLVLAGALTFSTGACDSDSSADDETMDGGVGGDDPDAGSTGTPEPCNEIDDDGDGRVDEDWFNDITRDGVAGIIGIDDDGDGSVDEGGDERDNDEDGQTNEDSIEPVVYRLSGSTLIERLPNLTPVDGTDFSEYVLAENVVLFAVRRLPRTAGARAELVELALELAGPEGETIPLTTRVRVGGAP